MRTTTLIAATTALLALGTSFVNAAPVITVKGRTALRFIGIYPGDEGALLVGQLQDKDLGTGIADKLVEVSLVQYDGRRRVYRARTDAEGEFRLTLPSGRQAYRLEARFAGDATYAPVHPPQSSMDMTKLTPEIQLELERELDIARATHRLKILTRAEGRNVSLPISLGVEGHRGIGRLTTSSVTGRAEARLATADLGRPGPVTVVARFAGNSEFNPATAQAETVLMAQVKVALRSAAATVHTDDQVLLSGTVTDTTGPISGATIGLEVMGRHVVSTLSEKDGSFAFELRAKDFPPGPLDLVAHFTPTVLWRREASSTPLQVTILPPTPIPVWFYAVPVAVTALLMVALLLVRFWPSLRHSSPEESSEPVHDAESIPEPIVSGAKLSRTSLRSLVKPAFDIHGVAWDPVDRRPIPRAAVYIKRMDGGAVELTTDNKGRFVVPGLPPGTHEVKLAKPGFVSESFQAHVPHRGNLHGVRVDLVQVRVRLLELYRNLALPLLPKERFWGRWTPRELSRHVGGRAGRRDPQLECLTRMLESAYWAASPASESILPKAQQLADRIGS